MFGVRHLFSVARFLASEAGALALSFAIAAPALLVMVGMATDYGFMVRYRTQLQAVADAAAIAGAKEIPLANSNQSQIIAVSNNFADYNLKQFKTATGSVDIDAQLIDSATAVKVVLSKYWTPFFAHLLFNDVTPISVTATARMIGGKICIVGLSTSDLTSIHMDDASRLNANDCGIYSLTPGSVSLQADRDAELRAELICVEGGYKASKGSSIVPAPVTDCPGIADPLEDRVAPSIGGCKAIALTIKTDTTLSPGTYCGDLKVQNGAMVVFSPGIYVIKDGKFSVNDASIAGDDVGFFLTGSGAVLEFTATSSISLSAPVTGDMAGLLFFEDRNKPAIEQHVIKSNNARRLVGTIYMPRGILRIEANAPVADDSAYTAIVVWRLQLKEGPNLVLNTDYSATDVPVPAALSGGRVVLSQ